MKVLVLMGSPRKSGNTQALLSPFAHTLEALGHTVEMVWLYDRQIAPCTACRACQRDWQSFGCAIQDDMQALFPQILSCDLIVLATPIYSWYCTPPLKALLDRLVYGMNKYYGEEKGPSLWAGKPMALITTCGYRPEAGADLWETGMRRYVKHSQLSYQGMLVERDLGYQSVFLEEGKIDRAKAFAQSLHDSLTGQAVPPLG